MVEDDYVVLDSKALKKEDQAEIRICEMCYNPIA